MLKLSQFKQHRNVQRIQELSYLWSLQLCSPPRCMQVGLRRAAAGWTSCAPSTSWEEQVLNFWMPGFPSGFIPK